MKEWDNEEKFMRSALREAEIAYDRGEVPIGAVLVADGKVIARGHNQVETLKDATAHAEMIAITSASENKGNWRLEDCTMYVTLEPCPMCTGAILNSRIGRVVYGCSDKRLGACDTHFQILEKNPINREVEVESGLLEEECRGILQAFFLELRERNKARKEARRQGLLND